jgi:predicted small lipoprotein YifL
VINAAKHRPALRSTPLLLIALIALAFTGATLSGCGQKGQLYLPSQKKTKVPQGQQPQDTPPAAQPPDSLPQSATAPTAS